MNRMKRLSWVLVLCLASVSAFAQIKFPPVDAPRVLAQNVSYGTAKATALPNLSAETKAQLEPLENAAREANAAGKYGEALKNLHHAQAVVLGRAWTPLRQLNSSLVLRTDHALPEPGQTIEVRLGQQYKPDEAPKGKLAATVVIAKAALGRGGNSDPAADQQLKTQEVEVGDWLSKPVSFSVTVPDLADGNYSLGVVLKPAEMDSADTPARAQVPVRVIKGLAPKVEALRARIKSTKDADPSAAYRVALYDLASTGDATLGRTDLVAEIATANAILDDAASKKDPWATRKGDLRKAYLSNVDKTLQPYRVFVPSSYDGSKKFPLVIALHGMGGDENSIFDQYQLNGQSVVEAQAEQRGYLVACPKGRGTADMYLRDAEKDVLDVLAAMEQAYKVDTDRIYLTGHSMGGYGTWSLAMSHPDLFTALAPISGGGNTMGMAKLAKIPQFVVHGDNDKTVPVDRSREMVKAGKDAGAEIVYKEVPGGSHVSVAAPAFPEIFAFFDSHPKKGGGAAVGQQDR